jgi:hypothetical protein
MGCLNSIVIVMILILIAVSTSTRADRLIHMTIDCIGSPTHSSEALVIWTLPEFKLCIARDTKVPVQLYFTWDKHIVRPRNELYKILSRVCTDLVNYDIGSSQFTVKDFTVADAFTTMLSIKNILN